MQMPGDSQSEYVRIDAICMPLTSVKKFVAQRDSACVRWLKSLSGLFLISSDPVRSSQLVVFLGNFSAHCPFPLCQLCIAHLCSFKSVHSSAVSQCNAAHAPMSCMHIKFL